MSDAPTPELNAGALAILHAALTDAAALGIARTTVGGATIIDCGVETPGSDAAGLLMARVALAGLGEVTHEPAESPRLFAKPCGETTSNDGDVWKRPVVS
ncbi:hypothetical protein EBU58_11825, partial [bacterium]|nr:hypothetical protein [bacterium]